MYQEFLKNNDIGDTVREVVAERLRAKMSKHKQVPLSRITRKPKEIKVDLNAGLKVDHDSKVLTVFTKIELAKLLNVDRTTLTRYIQHKLIPEPTFQVKQFRWPVYRRHEAYKILQDFLIIFNFCSDIRSEDMGIIREYIKEPQV